MKSPVCSICGAGIRKIREFYREKGLAIGLYACDGCRSEMLFPQPPDDFLTAEYKEYYSRRTKFTKGLFVKEGFFRDILVANSFMLPQGRGFSALELGSGEGDFVKAFNAVFPGRSITAVEMNREGAENLKRLDCRYVPAFIEEFLEKCAENYDVIFMFDVIEHLRRPVETMEKVAAVLRPGGKVFLTAPLAGSKLHLLTGRLWPQYKLEHIFYFSKDSFYRMGERLGLKVLEVSPFSKKLPVSYLLSVGAHFGPHAFSLITGWVARILPERLCGARLKLPLGEAFVVYGKNP